MEQLGLFEDHGWLDPDERRRRIAAALQGRDVAGVLAGFDAFLRGFGHPESSRGVWGAALGDFLAWLWLWQGREGLDLRPGDVEAWAAALTTAGRHRLEGNAPRRPLAAGSLRTWLHGLRRAVDFFAWAGHPWPDEVRWPVLRKDRADQQPPVTHEEFGRLLAAADGRPEPERTLLRAILYLAGDAGLRQREMEHLRLGDYAEGRLGVRKTPYYVERRIDLSPAAREAVEAWLEARARLGALPEEEAFFVSPRRRVPLKQDAFARRLAELFEEAGVGKGRRMAARRLRSRARELAWQRLGKREAVAEFLGVDHPEGPVWTL
ncbi:hypothetical protein Ocepr_2296 (plasmid) [Oceanithermus profundus DSM 14977]|uniref:Tyr recombinase domain-containing protein n=1 Tax=Oceanithermus profundus (strain DSM 14977 / NBRC 100410 / VKM B-2274 / 506) TaxID=670487 RepID=E4UAV9_OCEP5|nr:tyrosine-type recombinase/integrase [Oceanithermus profundus]ADR37744.1 hypothetical protein Ocepr_2296 [Oceanithermus profundus DSM 14977]